MPNVLNNPNAAAVAAARARAAGQTGAAKQTAQGDILSAETGGRALVGGEQAGATGDALRGYYGGLGQAYAGMYGGFGQAEGSRYGALAGLAGAMSQDAANRYGAYSAAEASRQQAMSNEASNRYTANAMAEAARQTSLGNLGSASIGAYGSAAGQAMQAWALNQQAYNQALAGMHTANQQAMSQYGMSRNNALGQLGQAAGDAGGRLGAATAVGDLSAEFGGNSGGGVGSSGSGFSVAGPDGPLAGGTYGGTGSSPADGGFYGSVRRSSSSSNLPGVADQTFGSIADSRYALMHPDILYSLNYGAADGMNRLDSQHATSRSTPIQMQAAAAEDIYGLGSQYLAPISSGMDQYYYNSNLDRPDFSAGMDQFYGAMGGSSPDYSPVLQQLSAPTQIDAPDFGVAPTLSGIFGGEAMGRSAMDDLGPMAGLLLSREVQQRDRSAAQELAHQDRIRAMERRRQYTRARKLDSQLRAMS